MRVLTAVAILALIVGGVVLLVKGVGGGVGPRCQDGTHATHTGRGACSHHGGYER